MLNAVVVYFLTSSFKKLGELSLLIGKKHLTTEKVYCFPATLKGLWNKQKMTKYMNFSSCVLNPRLYIYMIKVAIFLM